MLCINTDNNNIQFTDDELYVLKKTWENLAEKNLGEGISKEVFMQYVQLNRPLQELLFDQFNIKKLESIDYEDFVNTLNLLCFGSNLDHAKFLFEMCDVDNSKSIQRSLLSLLLNSIPNDLIIKENESIDDYVKSIFNDANSIKCEDFKHWATTVPLVVNYIKDHIPYNVENNLQRRQSVDKLDILPKINENIEYESWLWKRCKRLGLLKKQYYYLRGSCLYYYNAQNDVKPQGIIYLVGSLVKHLGDKSFEIIQLDLCSNEHNIHESRILYCDTEETRNEWVNKLQDASHMHLFEDKYYLYTGLKIGEGNYSNVYKCTSHSNFDVQYAVKIIDKTKFGLLDKEHFRAEINVLKMLDHPNIIKTYDTYETMRTISIVTELISDGDLFEYILKKKCFDDNQLRPLMSQLLSCAQYLHTHGIIHSDIKPENILYDKLTGQIKLIDFGLSKILLPNKKIEILDGTLSYVAPEALRSNIYCAESDVWSIGVIMYLLVYGRLPFDPLPYECIKFDVNQCIMCNILTKELRYNYTTKSALANDLLKKLLEKDPLLRLSAQNALQEPFFIINNCDYLSK